MKIIKGEGNQWQSPSLDDSNFCQLFFKFAHSIQYHCLAFNAAIEIKPHARNQKNPIQPNLKKDLHICIQTIVHLQPPSPSLHLKMGKKIKLLPLLFKSNESSSSSSSSSLWLWGTCNHPKTLSFRANNNSDIFKTMNTVYIDSPDSSYSSTSSKTIMKENRNGGGGDEGGESVEAVIKGLSSERFFCEVTGETSSILEEANNKKGDDGDGSVALFKESVAMEMESRDPYVDFRRSMEEMMEANHGSLKDNWDFLEELLACYLKVNKKCNHGYIVGAFVDLLIGLEFASASNTDSLLSSSTSNEDQCCCSNSSIGGGGGGRGGGHSFTSPLSFYSSASSTSPCLSSLIESEDEIEKSVESDSRSSLIFTNV